MASESIPRFCVSFMSISSLRMTCDLMVADTGCRRSCEDMVRLRLSP
jgi:hypothetical protein